MPNSGRISTTGRWLEAENANPARRWSRSKPDWAAESPGPGSLGPMDEYEVVFARSARRELEALPERLAGRVLRRIEGLRTTPRPRGCRKLVSSDSLWRLRVGDHRIVYAV